MRLVLCDGHGMFLDALVMALTSLGHDVVSSCERLDELESRTDVHQPDLCLLDVGVDGRSGLDVASRIRRRHPHIGLLLLTGTSTEGVWRAHDTGVVDGLVNKICDIALLDRAMSRVIAGERVVEGFARPVSRQVDGPRSHGLTTREQEVLWLLTRGVSTDQMACELGVSTNTVRTHVQNVLHKLGVTGRSKAVHLAMHMDLVSLAGSVS